MALVHLPQHSSVNKQGIFCCVLHLSSFYRNVSWSCTGRISAFHLSGSVLPSATLIKENGVQPLLNFYYYESKTLTEDYLKFFRTIWSIQFLCPALFGVLGLPIWLEANHSYVVCFKSLCFKRNIKACAENSVVGKWMTASIDFAVQKNALAFHFAQNASTTPHVHSSRAQCAHYKLRTVFCMLLCCVLI